MARRKRKRKRRSARRRSGNGTWNIQWFYVLWNFPCFWVVKIGITGEPITRWANIDKTSFGWDFPIYAVRIFCAYQVEQGVHRLCRIMKVYFNGSGHTERFFVLAAIPALIFSLIVFILQWAAIIGGATFILVTISNPEHGQAIFSWFRSLIH